MNGGHAGESAIDTDLYEGGRRGTKRTWEEDYGDGMIFYDVLYWRPFGRLWEIAELF